MGEKRFYTVTYENFWFQQIRVKNIFGVQRIHTNNSIK